MEIEFSRQTTKNKQISNFMKIHPDGQTHRGTYGGTDERSDVTDRYDEANSRFL